MWQHGTSRGFPHILIEVRNDLIETPEGQEEWAGRLAPLIRDSVIEMEAALAAAPTEPISEGETDRRTA
jgi:predicted N-formylglutamate amidohydrolase